MSGILVVGEAQGVELRPVSLELMTAGRRLADALSEPLLAVLLGADISEAARQLGAGGADRLLVADDGRLADFISDATTAVVSRIIDDEKPSIVLIPGTTAGRDYAPRIAARLRTGLAADCIDLQVEDGHLVAVRPVLGGRMQAAVRMPGSAPRMATVRPGSFPKAEASAGSPDPEPVSVELSDDDLRVTVRETLREEAGAVNLEAADVIVSGGRGLKEPDNFRLVEELAAALGAAVGASRAVVDAGWRPHQEQVGQTGRTVAPRLYIAVGISGAVQHLVGMQSADYIVAINRDPDAPIFKIASFGIVGDLFEVVPALIAELQAGRS